MSLTVLSHSHAFRAVSLFMAATLTYSASAAGLNALALGAVELGSQVLRGTYDLTQALIDTWDGIKDFWEEHIIPKWPTRPEDWVIALS